MDGVFGVNGGTGVACHCARNDNKAHFSSIVFGTPVVPTCSRSNSCKRPSARLANSGGTVTRMK